MRLTMMKCKLHRAVVTQADLHYEGSISIDRDFLEAAGILPYEQVDVLNINNGQRFTTYIIRGEDDSGIISVNGAAAHHASVGDRIIICAYGNYSEEELANFKPKMVYMNEDNTVSHTSFDIPVQVA